MKITNIFKKEKTNTLASKVEALGKDQLSRVVGGTDDAPVTPEPQEGKLKGKIVKSGDTGMLNN